MSVCTLYCLSLAGFQITYQHQSSCYQISVENPHRVKGRIVVLELDGVQQADC
ncbi:MAG: hypothetical protein ACKN9F_07360 [Methylomonas sp.]